MQVCVCLCACTHLCLMLGQLVLVWGLVARSKRFSQAKENQSSQSDLLCQHRNQEVNTIKPICTITFSPPSPKQHPSGASGNSQAPLHSFRRQPISTYDELLVSSINHVVAPPMEWRLSVLPQLTLSITVHLFPTS